MTQGTTVTGPCTTDATGRCCNVGVSGAYSVLVTATGYISQTLTGTATCPPPPHPITYGPDYPATWADDATIGTGVWSNPGNAGASDSVYATATSTGNVPTHYLKGTNPGFAMATDGTELVLGIGVQVGVKASAAATDYDVRLVVGGTIGATNLAVGTAISTGVIAQIGYGGPTNMWGYGTGGITAAQANATGLGLVFSAKSPGGGGGGSTNTGAVYVGTCVDGGAGSFTWTAPGNATANDGVFATAGTNNGQQTDLLKGTNLGLSVPTGATILGILLEVGAKASGTTADEAAYLVKAGTVLTGTNRATGAALSTGAVATLAYGGAADLWGTTWTPADVNATGFGGAWAAVAASVTTRTVSVDWMRITVTYSVPTATTISVDYGRMLLYTTRNTYELDVSLVPTTFPVVVPQVVSCAPSNCAVGGAIWTFTGANSGTYTTCPDGTVASPCGTTITPIRMVSGTTNWTLDGPGTDFVQRTGSVTFGSGCGGRIAGDSGTETPIVIAVKAGHFCLPGIDCYDTPPAVLTVTLTGSSYLYPGTYTLSYSPGGAGADYWFWESACLPKAGGTKGLYLNFKILRPDAIALPCVAGEPPANSHGLSGPTPILLVCQSGDPVNCLGCSGVGQIGGPTYMSGTVACPVAITYSFPGGTFDCSISE